MWIVSALAFNDMAWRENGSCIFRQAGAGHHFRTMVSVVTSDLAGALLVSGRSSLDLQPVSIDAYAWNHAFFALLIGFHLLHLIVYASWKGAGYRSKIASQTVGRTPSDGASQKVIGGGHRLAEPRLDSCAAIL